MNQPRPSIFQRLILPQNHFRRLPTGKLDYRTLEPRQLLTTVSAPAAATTAPAASAAAATPSFATPSAAASAASEIAATFSSDANSPEFSYQTNVGPLNQPNSRFVSFAATGDPLLRFNANGGHPGLSESNAANLEADRFAIVSYEVQTSGYYEIIDSFLRVADVRSNGVEFRVFINNGPPIYSGKTTDQGLFYFDTRIGYVAQGDTIRIAFGGNGDSSYDSFRSDFSLARFSSREQVVGSYRNDFATGTNGQSSQWQYLWNAPHTADTNPFSSGALEDRTSYRPLQLAKNLSLRPEDTSNAIVGRLTLHRNGGHPGNGYPSRFQAQNRYAIAAFTVDQSGDYAIRDSFLRLTNRTTDGIEVVIGTSGSDTLTRRTFGRFAGNANADNHFDLGLGNLSKGDTIYVAFGAGQTHIRDSFQTDFSVVRILPREAPLRNIAVPRTNTLHAADFGAIANDRIDDYVGIANALAAAAEIDGPTKLVFQKGVYNLDNIPDGQRGAILIERLDDFVFEGQGAQFFISDPTVNFLNVWQSERVILRNFEVDYAQRYSTGSTVDQDVYRGITFTQGIIEKVNQRNQSIVLKVDPTITVPPSTDFYAKDTNPLGSGFAIDPQVDGRSKFNTPLRYLPIRGYELRGGSTTDSHRIFFRNTDGLEVGDRFAIQRRGQQVVIGIFRGSNQVTITGVVAYSSPATFISAGRSDNICILHSHAKIKSGRFKGINADAVHIQGNREGVWVEDSSFVGVGDDIANLYSLPSVIVNVVSPTELDLAVVAFDSLVGSSTSRYQPGDRVIFYQPIQGRSLREARVVSAELIRSGQGSDSQLISRVKFDQPINGAVVAQGNDDPVLRYRNDIQVFNRELSKNGLIQNTLFANSRRYGLFLMAENVQVVDSNFTGLNSSAIAGYNQTGWPLGNIPRDILIQNNDFNTNGFSNQYFTNDNFRAVVSFRLDRLRDQVVDRHSNLISNLTIADNRFRLWGKTALSVRNAQHIHVNGNRFFAGGSGLTPDQRQNAIEVEYSRDVRVEDSQLLTTPRTDSANFVEDFRNRDATFESPFLF